MKASMFFFFFAVILSPLYFFQSGGVQISDFFFFLSLLTFLISNKSYLLFNEVKYFSKFIYLRIFIFWTFLVNLSVFIYWQQLDTFISSFYYVYNYLILLLTFSFFRLYGNSFLTKAYYSFFISVILVFSIAILNLDYLFSDTDPFTLRRTVTFNNPNQLGYWTLMILTVQYILKKILQLNKVKYFKIILPLVIIMTFYLSVISLSKASMVSLVILIILNSVRNFKIILFLSLVSIASFSYVEFEDDNFISRAEKRLYDIGRASDDSLEGRNYDRILKYPEYVFFGAGEGTIAQRFNTDSEIHSTIGTIIFSYGLIGSLMFFLFISSYVRSNIFSFFAFLLPLFLYSITHMGLRSKIFWIILILIFVHNKIENKEVLQKLK